MPTPVARRNPKLKVLQAGLLASFGAIGVDHTGTEPSPQAIKPRWSFRSRTCRSSRRHRLQLRGQHRHSTGFPFHPEKAGHLQSEFGDRSGRRGSITVF
jgi:hypothetical protein